MDHLGDDVLADIFQSLPWRDRARLAFVCRRWRAVSCSTHAAVVWQSLSIEEAQVGFKPTWVYGSLVRWCQARACHIRVLHILVAEAPPMWILGDPEDIDDTGDDRDGTHGRLLDDICAILFAAGSQLQELWVLTSHVGRIENEYARLPRKTTSLISLALALERLTVAIPEQRDFHPLTMTVRSLRKLKVAALKYVGDRVEDDHPDSVGQIADDLLGALCCCPLLEDLKLVRMHIGNDLPVQLSAATQLTSLVLRDPEDCQMRIAASALPSSLRRLRLTEDIEDFAVDIKYHDAITVPRLPRHFAGLTSLQHLHVTWHSWGVQCLPPGLCSLRLEAPADLADSCHNEELLQSISSLVSLRQLYVKGFKQLGIWSADVAAALQPLRRLQALGFDTCGLQKSPATAILSQLTLLSLRNNGVTTLADALPAGVVQKLRLLDLSGNALGRPPDAPITHWTTGNVAAVSGNLYRLEILGMRPAPGCKVTGRLKMTAMTLTNLLRRQAATAEPPRPPPTVVCSQLHEELLRPADELAVVR